MSVEAIDMRKYKKGIRKAAEMLADLARKSHERRERLLGILIPLLKPRTIRRIVAYEKEYYITCKIKVPLNDALLKKNLGDKITEFDANISWLEEKDMPAFARTINKDPLLTATDAEID